MRISDWSSVVCSSDLPGSNSTAGLLGGLLIHGIQPGPLLFEKHPDVIYGLFGGLFVANAAMFIIGIVVLTPTIWLVNRPKPYLMAAIYAHIFSAGYPRDHTPFDTAPVLIPGPAGHLIRLFGFPLDQLERVKGTTWQVRLNYGGTQT